MNISTFFKLKHKQDSLDFIDINLDKDNELFIDPRLIEISKSRFAKDANLYIGKFWSELLIAIRNKEIKNAGYLLSGMKEPNETKLGYAKIKKYGNNISDKIRAALLNALQANKAVRSGVLSNLADTELLVEDIGCDRISDSTTKIAKLALINFTKKQCKLHNITTTKVMQEDIFDHEKSKWIKLNVELPVYKSKPIIFVPRSIVRLSNVSNSNISSFYRYAIRNFIANDPSMLKDISPSGKDGELLLRDIKAAYPLSKESLSNWSIKYGKLLVDFKSFHLKDKVLPATIKEIENIVYE